MKNIIMLSENEVSAVAGGGKVKDVAQTVGEYVGTVPGVVVGLGLCLLLKFNPKKTSGAVNSAAVVGPTVLTFSKGAGYLFGLVGKGIEILL